MGKTKAIFLHRTLSCPAKRLQELKQQSLLCISQARQQQQQQQDEVLMDAWSGRAQTRSTGHVMRRLHAELGTNASDEQSDDSRATVGSGHGWSLEI